MKFKSFKVIREPQLIVFEKKIRKHLKEGWLLHGRLIIADDLLYQALILPR
jgi:hypothetical protein